MKSNIITQEYKDWIRELKQKFQQAQIKASVQVNSTLLEFYWNLGSDIIEKQKKNVWGSGFLNQTSKDLSDAFPDVKGFSKSNLQYIRRWVLFYSNSGTSCATIGKSEMAQVVPLLVIIPWGHNRVIISKCQTQEEALFYVQNTIKNGISRSVLIHQIESKLYERQDKAITNFSNTLPPLQSDLAKEIVEDSFNFDFKSSLPSIEEIENELNKDINS